LDEIKPITEFVCRSAEETFELGVAFGREVLPNAVLLFHGELGAGKTTFIKGFASAVLGSLEIEVTSPTFTYLNIYTQPKRLRHVYHFDLYRLPNAEEFLNMGFDEMLEAGGFCCVEWAERIAELHIPQAVHLQMAHFENGARSVRVRDNYVSYVAVGYEHDSI
jgi:tRNA threonylcarbamoyladenosine biosynthesis protein TsaE